MVARGSVGLALALILAPAALSAQVPRVRPQKGDSAAAQDTVGQYAALEAATRERAPAPPRIGGEGPLPGGTRLVFTRDSIDWGGALTLGDLIAQVPGVYLWRAGGVGRPEMVNYAARGQASIEVLLDGMPYGPLGPDSVAVDPATIPLELIDRVEIERWPSQLRVALYTRNNDRRAAKSNIVLAAGPSKLAHYAGFLERRSQGGVGFGGGFDFLKVPPPTGATGNYQHTGYWAQISYVPDVSHGIVLEYVGATLDRDAFSDGGVTGSRLEGGRGELRGRAFLGGRPDGTGLRLDLLGGRSSFDSMGVAQTIWRGGAAITYRTPLLSAATTALAANRWTKFDLSGRIGWTPVPLVVVALEGAWRAHDGDRTTRWAGARAGLQLPAHVELFASGRVGQMVAAPADPNSPEQDIKEAGAGLSWTTRRIGAEGRISHTAAFQPMAYQELPSIVTIAPSPATTWLSSSGYLRPLDWITVRGWYAQASNASPAGLPARHWAVMGTIRSQLLHTFRSGAFDLKLELGYEGWRAGVLGENGSASPVGLPEAHYVRSLVQVGIKSWSVFWESRNLSGEAVGYVPGYSVPKFSGMFGVRWGFLN